MSFPQTLINQLSLLAPAGYYLALRVGFSFPEVELNQLPDRWVEFYTTHGFVVHDPAMKWVYGQTGATRLSAIDLPDPQQIRRQGELFGLGFGAAVSVTTPADHGKRSYGFFFRADREMEEAELSVLQRLMEGLHGGAEEEPSLTNAEIEALRLQAEGLRLKQIAARLGISESAVKARLNNVKRKLGARTQSQAASIAAARRFL